MLDKQQIISRLCALATKVGEDAFNNRKAHDCFCGDNKVDGRFSGGFQFEEEVLCYIESAVNHKLSKIVDNVQY